MSRRRRFLLCCALPLVVAAPASAAPPGQTVVFEEHVVNEPFSRVDFFPCLGEEGMDDDEAQIDGVETRHVRVTAAGVDDEGLPIAPFRVYAFFAYRATVDPLLAGLPAYRGTARSLFIDVAGRRGRFTLADALFRAQALDGSGSLRFRVHHVLVIDARGVVRLDRTVEGCSTS
jgi:hypothetical protein